MPTVNKTCGEVVIDLVCLFLLSVRKSCSRGTRQSSRGWWGGSRAWVRCSPIPARPCPLFPCAPPGRGSAARLWRQQARSLREHFLQQYYSFLKKQTCFESNPVKVLPRCGLSSSSLHTHTRVCMHTHMHAHTLATPALTPQQPPRPFSCLCYPLPPSE